MPEPLTSTPSRLWDAMYGDVKFLVLEYKLRGSWTSVEDAQSAIVQLLEYHGAAQQEYWKFVRGLRLMSLFERLLRSGRLPEDVARVVRRTDKAIFLKSYQPYLAKFWNWEFLTKRQSAKKNSEGPYKVWSWSATRAALNELAAKRPNTYRHVVDYYEDQLKEMAPMKPPSLLALLRLMRDIKFDMEAA